MSMSHDQDNPFAPPKAAVLAAQSDDGEYIPDGQRVPSSRGSTWFFPDGWNLFAKSPGTWVLMFVLFMVISLVLVILPGGGLVSSLCYPAVAAGVMIGCNSLEEGGELRLGHLFAGFRNNVGNLLLVGILYLVGSVVIWIIAIIVGLMVIPLVAGSMTFNPNDARAMLSLLPAFLLVALIVLALTMPLLMAMWFAPALVVFHEVPPMAAMRSSFNGCLKNMVPFLLYGLVGLLLALIAMIPIGLGLLVVGPLVWVTTYLGYRDIFVRRA